MKTLILFVCLIEITLQAPTAQQTNQEPPSVEIFLPHGYHASDIRQLLPSAMHGNPAAGGQNGFPGYASIEYLVPVGDPGQHPGIPAALHHMLPPQAYVKQKHLHSSHRAGHETGNPSSLQHTAPQEASIEIIVPHNYQAQQFEHQLLANSYHDRPRALPLTQGHASIEMLFPHSRTSLRAPQHLESMPPSQGYVKHEIPQPPGAPSIEVMYPIPMGHQKADEPSAKSVHGCHRSSTTA